MRIQPYVAFGEVRLGDDEQAVVSVLGFPETRVVNREGELELQYEHTVARLAKGSVVEVTSRPEALEIGDDRISRHRLPAYLLEWDADAKEKCGFVISPKFGIAVDTDTQNDGWISVFVNGRWDEFLNHA